MATSGSTVIRVFLSSTFVDFQEERSLLVKQVFPSLRRRARSRGVEIVDVDLRWGVTADQTERGETLPLCLAEIDRCRPYFISLLGERYGWVPPADPTYYKPALLERQPWLKERMGGASLTELEILHGVLRNPEMAGHAFFYLRDPAYAQAQPEPGWVADNLQERQRLSALKEEVRRSGFPVSEGLTAPQAIAERIEADLWAVIEREHPEQEPQAPLQQEQQRHSDYRRARTGLYLGGETAITQLESWIEEGEQRILITGESGAGKSALIANWLEAHQKSAPQDLVHAHHLGCTNDASAVRPMLARLIDTASLLLLEEEQIAEPLKVPQDWWELVFKVGEVFALLSPLCQRQKRRWILVLDGLDRLAEDDKQALPWIPTTIPPGIHVVASALDCTARTILQERQYCSHEIGPLGKAEQQQLIERYLSRYTKQLESGLQQRILAHRLAGSPLFLKVLLEELRQCAWFDTLGEQLEFYLSTESIDWLYARVLERLELDGHAEATRRSLTALWASRAGLSETELLAITGLAHLEWAPVDLALSEAFGRNGERLVFDHDYIRIAVQDRYLPLAQERCQAHRTLADWYCTPAKWDERKAEELPWQLMRAGRLKDLRSLLLRIEDLYQFATIRKKREVIDYWQAAKGDVHAELDELIADAVEREIKTQFDNPLGLILFVDCIAGLLDEAGLQRTLLLHCRALSLKLYEATEGLDETSILNSLSSQAGAHLDIGNYNEAESLYLQCLKFRERLQGSEHPSTLTAVNNLGLLYSNKGDYEQAEAFYTRCIEAQERLLGSEHPDTLTTIGNLGALHSEKGNYAKAESCLQRCLAAQERLLGIEHHSTIIALGNLGGLYRDKGDFDRAEAVFRRCLDACEQLLGPEHPFTLTTIGNLGGLHGDKGDYEQAEVYYTRYLAECERLLGPEHRDTNGARVSLANLLSDQERYEEAIALRRQELGVAAKRDGRTAPGTLTSVYQLGQDLFWSGELEESEQFLREALDGHIECLGDANEATMACRYGLARSLVELGRDTEALPLLDHLLATLSAIEHLDEQEQIIHKAACHLLDCITTEG